MKDLSPLSISSSVVGFPARLCVITRMDGSITRIAESNEAIPVEGDTYSVIPGLQISGVKHTANGENPSCQINGVHGSGFTFDSTDIDLGLFDGAKVELYSVDRLNLTRKGLLFTGTISNTSTDPITHQFSFSVMGYSVKARIIMTQKRSPMCRTDVFSMLCGLNKALYAVSATVVTVGDATGGLFGFTVSGLTQDDGYFNQGVGVTDGGVAFEIASWVKSTQTIKTYLPRQRLLTVGMGLTLYPGCNKVLESPNGCAKFSNQLNFVGEPHFLGTAAAAQQV
ncbi:baseplate hub protein [Bradyrhizobium sp. PMVTL-01]|uniref:baseplate hub domain-containing protein n=1 Tax=Bradyrhizobium sp. PMVTL-01 TaxID=3434999 RepID=UPI003F6FFF3D